MNDKALMPEIWYCMASGMTPTETDRHLRLPKGKSHDLMVDLWARDSDEPYRRTMLESVYR